MTLERALERTQEDMQHKNIEMAQQIVTQRDRIKKLEDTNHVISEKLQNSVSENKRYQNVLQDYRASLQSKVAQISKLRQNIKNLEIKNQQLLGRVSSSTSKKVPSQTIYRQELMQYQVKRGETLRSIAGYDSVYGDREKWRLIYDANRDKISNPNHLVPGQLLEIPRE